MKKVRIGLAGLGVVGRGVYEILKKDAKLIAEKSKNQLELVAVSSRTKKNFITEPEIRFYEKAIDLAFDPEINVVVEVIGGTSVAKDLCEACLQNGKKYVTANKALIAECGFDLAKLAEEKNTYLAYEAAVAGAIPIIKSFKEGLAANEIEEFYAILNGTCNFILTKMQQDGLDFDVALKQAQELGFAELDPAFDIKGIDTAHKLTILAAIASVSKPEFSQLFIEGIDEITKEDISLADELGYKIKLLAIYKKLANGQSQQTVYPALVKKDGKIAMASGSYNAILTKASNADVNFVIGGGAGSLPTASAVVADLVDIANDRYSFTFGASYEKLSEAKIVKINNRVGAYFVKLIVDKNLAQKSSLAKEIGFGEDIEKTIFIDRENDILCGFLISNQKEEDLVKLLENLDSKLVKSAKFIRVEDC